MFKDLFPSDDKKRGKKIVKHVEKGFKIIAENWADMQSIPYPTDNPIANEVRTSHSPYVACLIFRLIIVDIIADSLEMEGRTILTKLADAKRMPRSDRHVQLKAIEQDAESFPDHAEIWAAMVKVSLCC